MKLPILNDFYVKKNFFSEIRQNMVEANPLSCNDKIFDRTFLSDFLFMSTVFFISIEPVQSKSSAVISDVVARYNTTARSPEM